VEICGDLWRYVEICGNMWRCVEIIEYLILNIDIPKKCKIIKYILN